MSWRQHQLQGGRKTFFYPPSLLSPPLFRKMGNATRSDCDGGTPRLIIYISVQSSLGACLASPLYCCRFPRPRPVESWRRGLNGMAVIKNISKQIGKKRSCKKCSKQRHQATIEAAGGREQHPLAASLKNQLLACSNSPALRSNLLMQQFAVSNCQHLDPIAALRRIEVHLRTKYGLKKCTATRVAPKRSHNVLDSTGHISYEHARKQILSILYCGCNLVFYVFKLSIIIGQPKSFNQFSE